MGNETKSADKAPKKQDKKLEKPTHKYYFPEQGVTVVAASPKEAHETMLERTKNKQLNA